MRWWEDPKRPPRHPRSVSRGAGIGSAVADSQPPRAPPDTSPATQGPPTPKFVSEHDRKLWEELERQRAYQRQWVRTTPAEPITPISDEKLQTILDSPQAPDDSRVAADLAEAQVAAADRCVVCGRPVIGAWVRRDDRGRPRHRRCP